MRSANLFLNIQLWVVALAVAIFTLGFTYFTLLVGLFIVATSYPALKIPKTAFYFFLIVLLSGTLIALIMITLGTFPEDEVKDVLLRSRFFWIRVLFALAVCVLLMRVSAHQILRFAYFIMLIQLGAGLYELFFTNTLRISMLTAEPSAAAMYYVFLAPLMIGYYGIEKKARIWIICYLVLGLFIQSKAQILVIPLIILFLVFRSQSKKLKIATGIALILVLICIPLFLGIKEVDRLVYFIDILKEKGIQGLTEQNRIWSTFTLRFSSVLTALQLIIENPMGIGFGGFHYFYIEKMTSSTIQGALTGVEIRGILNGELYATPKSIFLEYAVSCGLFFIIPIILIIKNFISNAIPATIQASFFALILISLLVELSPFMTFLGMLMILFHKLKRENIELLA